MTHPLTSLDKNKVMPEDKSGVTVLLDKEGNQYVSPSEHFKWGFNKSNAFHRELVLECDVENLAKIFQYYPSECVCVTPKQAIELAKSIIESMPSWCSLGKEGK